MTILTKTGAIQRPSFSGDQSRMVRQLYGELATEVNSWIPPPPTRANREARQRYQVAAARKRAITLEHAQLYQQLMEIYRCEVKNVCIM